MQLMNQQPTTLSLAQQPPSQADADRKRAMRLAGDAYRGKLQPPLKVTQGQPDDNVLSNRCAPIVDKGVSFLFGQVLKIEATEEATSSDSKIQEFLDGLWGGDDDNKMTLLSQAAINGGVCGQAFLKLIPPQGEMPYPRIVVLDPLLMRVVTSPDDCSLILAYIIEYPGPDDYQKKQIIARVDPDGLAGVAGEYDLDDTWTITNYIKRGQSGNWLQVGEAEQWPYPFPPIFMCQNLPNPNEVWGKPDLTTDIIGMNQSINFMLSNTARIVKYHGHPKTWVKGARAGQINTAVDETIVFDSPDAELNVVSPMDNFAGLLSIIADLRSDMDEQSRVPAVALGRMTDMPKGNISGVALQLLFQPLLEKTTIKRRIYGQLIRDISRASLVVAGLIDVSDYGDFPINLHWGNLLPVDDLAAAQTAMLLQQLGVSNATILQQLGYNPEDEANKSAEEDAKKMVAYSRGQGLPPASVGVPGQGMMQQQGGQQ